MIIKTICALALICLVFCSLIKKIFKMKNKTAFLVALLPAVVISTVVVQKTIIKDNWQAIYNDKLFSNSIWTQYENFGQCCCNK